MNRLPSSRPTCLARAFAAVAALALGGAGASAQVLEKEPPPAIRGLEIVEHLGDTIPLDLTFTDSSGASVAMRSFFGENGKKARPKPVVLALVYYRCPMQCKTVLQRLNDRLSQLTLTIGDDFNVAVVSFDPSEKPAAAAKVKEEQFLAYGHEHPKNLDTSWRFMTSGPTEARKLADSVGFPYRYMPESNEYSHGTVIFVLTPEGRISRYLYGMDFPPEQLKLALLEASGGKIGTTFDRILIWCFHYDPNAGAYTLQAVRVMQICGILTVTGLGSLLGGLWYMDRRRRRARGVVSGNTTAASAPRAA